MGSLSQFWGRPAAKAAVCALQLLPDGQSVQILALTKASLDCWQVSPAEPHTPYISLSMSQVIAGTFCVLG